MTIRQRLTKLHEARTCLAAGFCRYYGRDEIGNHCGVGALAEVLGMYDTFGLRPSYNGTAAGTEEEFITLMTILNHTAWDLYPELKGAEAVRPNLTTSGLPFDCFDTFPLVYLNNVLGRNAVLEIYDTTISRLARTLPAPALAPVPVPVEEEELCLV